MHAALREREREREMGWERQGTEAWVNVRPACQNAYSLTCAHWLAVKLISKEQVYYKGYL